jgi:hypothetical protein
MVDLPGEPRMQHQIQERRCLLNDFGLWRVIQIVLQSLLNRVTIVLQYCCRSQLLCNSYSMACISSSGLDEIAEARRF